MRLARRCVSSGAQAAQLSELPRRLRAEGSRHSATLAWGGVYSSAAPSESIPSEDAHTRRSEDAHELVAASRTRVVAIGGVAIEGVLWGATAGALLGVGLFALCAHHQSRRARQLSAHTTRNAGCDNLNLNETSSLYG